MAWTYLAESEVSQSPWLPGRAQSPTVKTIDTINPIFFAEWQTAYYLLRQSGTTSELSGESICHRSIWSTVVSPAKTSALQDVAQAWRATSRACSYTWFESRKRSSLLLSFWKTRLPSVQGDLVALCSNWPAWGSMRDGRLFLPKRLVPVTREKDGSSLLPTPTASTYGSNIGGGSGRQGKVRRSIYQLANRGSLPGHPQGLLNPEWIEQAMGYPIGWTALEPWAMQWFRSKRAKPSKGSQGSEDRP